MFHIPPQLKWDANSIHRALDSRGLNSRVEGENVVLEFQRTGAVHQFLSLLEFLVPSLRRTLTIEYCRDCTVGSVDLHCHPKAPFDDAIRHVEAVMRDHGYIEIGTEATVREIANGMNADTAELNLALDEYDSHQANYTPEATNEWACRRDLMLAKIERLLVKVAPR